MSRTLRVFISSTMRDLANERDAVCNRLRSFNFEPVNAEGWYPSGSSSWETIVEEIESSDIFLLILGERYGWIPDSGPMSDKNKSVTHLEFLAAKDRDVPVLPFLKKLSYDSDRDSDDAKRRDIFRGEVSEWAKGSFVGHFDLARDLSNSAANAVVGLLTNDFQKSQLKQRAPFVGNAASRLLARDQIGVRHASPGLPTVLVSSILRGEGVLFAGAGMSLSAGMPSAMAAASHLVQTFFPELDAGNLSFAQLASAIETQYSREALLGELRKLLDPPQGVAPTSAHLIALELFNQIITTNWDSLFETAASELGDNRTIIHANTKSELPDRFLIKLHGSMSFPDTIVVNEQDVYQYAASHKLLWDECEKVISNKTPVFVGTSLHDPSVIRLLEESTLPMQGFIVMPHADALARARFSSWGLTVVEATADEFLLALKNAAKTAH